MTRAAGRFVIRHSSFGFDSDFRLRHTSFNMTDPSPILDYASPRPRRKLRLPARSVLDVRVDPDGMGMMIVEKLAGIPQALVGIVFAVFVLLVVGMTSFLSLRTQWVKHHGIDPPGVILAVLWVVELILLFIVIERTWLRTILTARDRRVILKFISPFNTREHRWPFEEVADLDVVATQEAIGMYALAELRFRATDDVPVHLFTDHRADEVVYIRMLLARVLAQEPAVPAPLAASAAAPLAPPAPPDGRTVSRLVDVRKTLRQRETKV